MPLYLAQLDCCKTHFKGLNVPSQLLGDVCALTGAPPGLGHLSGAAAGPGLPGLPLSEPELPAKYLLDSAQGHFNFHI